MFRSLQLLRSRIKFTLHLSDVDSQHWGIGGSFVVCYIRRPGAVMYVHSLSNDRKTWCQIHNSTRHDGLCVVYSRKLLSKMVDPHHNLGYPRYVSFHGSFSLGDYLFQLNHHYHFEQKLTSFNKNNFKILVYFVICFHQNHDSGNFSTGSVRLGAIF